MKGNLLHNVVHFTRRQNTVAPSQFPKASFKVLFGLTISPKYSGYHHIRQRQAHLRSGK